MSPAAPRVVVLTRTYAAALLVLGAAAVLLQRTYPSWATAHPSGKGTVVLAASRAFPDHLGLWRGTPIAVEERIPAILETEDIAIMEYRMGEEPPVWVSRVGGFETRASFHPPELCYVGSNFEVLERGPMTVMIKGAPHRLMRLVIRQGQRSFEAWYWLTANGRVTPSYYQQQLWLIVDAIRRQPLSGELVRISTPLDDPKSAHRRLLAFLTSFDTTPAGIQVARHDL